MQYLDISICVRFCGTREKYYNETAWNEIIKLKIEMVSLSVMGNSRYFIRMYALNSSVLSGSIRKVFKLTYESTVSISKLETRKMVIEFFLIFTNERISYELSILSSAFCIKNKLKTFASSNSSNFILHEQINAVVCCNCERFINIRENIEIVIEWHCSRKLIQCIYRHKPL